MSPHKFGQKENTGRVWNRTGSCRRTRFLTYNQFYIQNLNQAETYFSVEGYLIYIYHSIFNVDYLS